MSLSFSGANNRMDGYSYDTAGNVLNDGVHSYTYDAENRIVTVDGGATTYVYDANGQRVRKTVGGASTDYVYDLAAHAIAEVNASGWQRGEVYASGRHLATYANSTTYFDHGDWLGTERVRTAVNGSVCESITSLPFGDGMNTTGSCADASTRHFTGKERDSESGLDNFGARYFSSNLGRFMSPDWAAKATAVPYATFGDPQSLNLYSYVGNNPLSHADVDGHCWPLCGIIIPLSTWAGAGVATEGGKQFASNVGTGIAKGAGSFAYNTLVSANPLTSLATDLGLIHRPAALSPSNTTQAQVSTATQITLGVGTAVATLGVGAGADAGAAVDTIDLFRAVGPAEADSIDSLGAFSPAPNGTDFKGFFFSQSDADNFGRAASNAFGEQTTTFSTQAPTSLVNSSPAHSAATEGPGVLIPKEQLNQLTTPKKVIPQ